MKTVIMLEPDWFILDGEWHRISRCYDGDMYKTYLDGKLVGEANSNGKINKDFKPEE